MNFRRRGVSLIEILVAMAISAMIFSALIPAVQSARSAARRNICQNHLGQLAKAALLHETAHSHFPSGGWGGTWVGDADRGFGKEQPGGWAFNVLPFVELDHVRMLSKGTSGSEKADTIRRQLQIPMAVFHCPERRAAGLYPLVRPMTQQPRQSSLLLRAAKSDYAINAGSQSYCELRRRKLDPRSLKEGDKGFAWPSTRDLTGVSFVRSEVKISHITSGTSHVYLLGEKSLPRSDYSNGMDHGDDWSVFTGYQDDLFRTTSRELEFSTDSSSSRAFVPQCGFGSAHTGGANMVFCDGHVELVSYDVNASIHELNGSRH